MRAAKPCWIWFGPTGNLKQVTIGKIIWSCLVALALAGGSLLKADELAARVVVLANSRDPDSVRLAEFYAEQRGVPRTNLVALPMPETEGITWREFIDQVYQPVQDELFRRGWIEGTVSSLRDWLGRKRYAFTGHRVSYLVVCRGVPLRIENAPTLLGEKPGQTIPAQFNRNEGAVDSELSLVAQSGYAIAALVPNPLFAKESPSAFEAGLVVRVSRLDGPTWESARRLVTSALEGENRGLLGRYYIDLKGPHPDGDRWLESVQTQLQELGFDGDTERTGATINADARFDAPVLYFGWYAANLNGPFAVEGFTFPPGAVALHIHSFSAQTLRSDSQGWCGPMVARGVTATVGNVFEPYLQLSHRPDLLVRALSQGKTFGEAAYFALPALSWQAVAIGDPLYRPFKVSLEEQERLLVGGPCAFGSYAVIRRANLLLRQGKNAEARAWVQSGLKQQPSLALALFAARLALAEGGPTAAVSALGFVPQLKEFRAQDWPLAREIASVLAAHGAQPAALQIYATMLRATAPTAEARKAVLMDARNTADAAGDVQLSRDYGRQFDMLTVPLVN